MPFEVGFPAGHERKGRALLGLQWECLSLGLGLWEGKGCKSLLAVRTCHRTRGACLGRKPRRAGGRGRHHQVGGLLPCSRADSHRLLYSGACCLDLETADCSSPGEGGRLTSFPSRRAPRRAPSRRPVLSSRPFSSHMERTTLYCVPLGELCLGSPSGHFLNKTKNGLW